jgi:hypothetical protein
MAHAPLVRDGVQHHAGPLASGTLVGLGRVAAAPNDGGNRCKHRDRRARLISRNFRSTVLIHLLGDFIEPAPHQLGVASCNNLSERLIVIKSLCDRAERPTN